MYGSVKIVEKTPTLYVLLRSIQLLSTAGLWSCLRLHSYWRQTPRSQSDMEDKSRDESRRVETSQVKTIFIL